MTEPRDDLAAILAAEARDAAAGLGADPGAGEHPDAERLVAYHQGALDEADAAAVRAHAVACPTCAGLLLDLETPFVAAGEDGSDEPEVADFERAAVWKAVRAEIAGDLGDRTAAGPVVRPDKAMRAPVRAPLLPWLVAAVLVVAAGALALRVRQLGDTVRDLETTIAALEAPQGGVPILYLDGVTRSELGDGALEVPAGTGSLVLILTPSEPERFDRYRVEVIDDAGADRAAVDDLARNEHGTVRVALSRRGLPPGRYTVRLLGVAGGGAAEPLDRYTIRILEGDGS